MNHKIIAEFIGTAFLLIIVVGSGIMGDRLSQGNEAVALLANSLATGAGLFVLIQCLSPVSGAHFNPVVSMVETLWGRFDKRTMFNYWGAQFNGAILGVFVTHLMFHQSVVQISQKGRFASNLWVSEVIATFGLIMTISLAGKRHVEFAPMSIAAYIMSAYWFTSSTSFANPAVTLARMMTNTFCGIDPNGVGPFILAQCVGAMAAYFVFRKQYNRSPMDEFSRDGTICSQGPCQKSISK
jgi:glycerol uptake facilitator-like aquaporin